MQKKIKMLYPEIRVADWEPQKNSFENAIQHASEM